MVVFFDQTKGKIGSVGLTVLLVLFGSGQLHAEAGEEAADEDGYVLRISLPTQEDHLQWIEPGFRLALGYGYGLYTDLGHDVDLSAHAISFRPHVRLSEHWAVGATINYSVSRGDLVQGLRWSTTLEATYYWLDQLGLSVGAGLGGLWLTCSQYDYGLCEPYLELGRTEESRYLTERERIADCEGGGLVGVARLDYNIVAGSNFASGPFVDFTAQRVRCVERTEKTSQETGRPIEIWAHWSHLGVNAGWWLTWR